MAAFRQRVGVYWRRCTGPRQDPSDHVSGYRRGEEWLNWSIFEPRASEPNGAQDDQRADANRLAHGQPKHLRKLEDAQQTKASRDLDRHRIETGDGR